ncbi:hypothetical protein LCGC14_0667760 [marine sediment metagenome]|uniref:Uncharacterized protein n=1 Tax=marine sediment metagenome TaxID=412755 RepID=A0A0F9RBY9_9ZZZZ
MIKKFIVRIIRLLKGVGVLKNIYKISYQGQGVSLNQYYSSGHWSIRYKLVAKYHDIFKDLFEESELKELDGFYLLMFYNSRHDVDNTVGLTKLFVDALKGLYVKEDNKKFYKGVMLFCDGSLPTNTFEFYILEDGNNITSTNRRCETQVELFEAN